MERKDWYPVPCDKAHCDKLRKDYEDKKDWSDEELIDHFDHGRRYSVLWDHIGDALDDYEPLADAMIDIVKAVEELIMHYDVTEGKIVAGNHVEALRKAVSQTVKGKSDHK